MVDDVLSKARRVDAEVVDTSQTTVLNAVCTPPPTAPG